MSDFSEHLAHLREIIAKEVFITKDREKIISKSGKESPWLFDFRRILLRSEVINLISYLFFEKLRNSIPFQIGGIESASLPLLTGLLMKFNEHNIPLRGFYIRKSRKQSGSMKVIEGELGDGKIILVDDLINSGKSFIKQIEILKKNGKKVDLVLTILRFRDHDYYTYFRKKNIPIISLFELNDFPELGVSNIIDDEVSTIQLPFEPVWYIQSPKPNFFYDIPKSAPVIDESNVYFGSDGGVFWAINQDNGSVVWQHEILFGSKEKYIFSSPAIFKDKVYFGAYDGNFYALNCKDGKRAWIYRGADWIGSSPTIAEDLGLVFIGLEFGLWKKQGAVVALDLQIGKKRWQFEIPGLVASSPAYAKKNRLVICGSNSFSVYGLNAIDGSLVWEYKTDGEVKASFAVDEKRGIVAFGSFDHFLHIVNIKDGSCINKFETNEAIFSTPIFYERNVYVGSLDKSFYCFDLDKKEILWKFETGSRVFSDAIIIDGKIYFGSNDGFLYELDPLTGKNTAAFPTGERITNKIAYNEKTKRFFVPTFANEMFCIYKS